MPPTQHKLTFLHEKLRFRHVGGGSRWPLSGGSAARLIERRRGMGLLHTLIRCHNWMLQHATIVPRRRASLSASFVLTLVCCALQVLVRRGRGTTVLVCFFIASWGGNKLDV
jgi:hypothetical protein